MSCGGQGAQRHAELYGKGAIQGSWMSYYLRLTLLALVPEAGLPDRVAHAPIGSSTVGLLGQTQHLDSPLGAAAVGAVAISPVTATA